MKVRDEPVTLYAETPPRLLRRLATVDVSPTPKVLEIETYLLEGETIRPDASRLFRSDLPHRLMERVEKSVRTAGPESPGS